jgi:hypothetical protein
VAARGVVEAAAVGRFNATGGVTESAQHRGFRAAGQIVEPVRPGLSARVLPLAICRLAPLIVSVGCPLRPCGL